MKIYELDSRRKLTEHGIQWNQIYKFDLRSGRNPCSEISKIVRLNLGEMTKISIPKF